MIKKFNKINFNHLLQEKNQMKDALAMLATMFPVNLSDEVQSIYMWLKEASAYCAQLKMR